MCVCVTINIKMVPSGKQISNNCCVKTLDVCSS